MLFRSVSKSIANKISKITNTDKFRCYRLSRDSLFISDFFVKAEKSRPAPG